MNNNYESSDSANSIDIGDAVRSSKLTQIEQCAVIPTDAEIEQKAKERYPQYHSMQYGFREGYKAALKDFNLIKNA